MDVAALVQSINIVEYISQYVELELRGDEWWGLSCFKEENTPSFSVREDPPVFYDYSSGKGGNIFNFVKEYHHCSNQEAVEILKAYAGVDAVDFQPRDRMAATLTCRKFAKPNKLNKQSKVKPLPNDYMLRYEKRDDKLDIWRQEGISDESLEKFQVYYDGFTDRLVYPIRNIKGEIVNIGGRTLDPLWKEKKLRKYSYFFSWGTMDTIYGLAENMESIIQNGEVILFEGCKSVLLADTWGIHNTGAILTSHLNVNQFKILARLGVRVVFALDKEVPIMDDKNINKLKQYVNVEFLFDQDDLLSEKDSPVDKGAEVFKLLYDQRVKLR